MNKQIVVKLSNLKEVNKLLAKGFRVCYNIGTNHILLEKFENIPNCGIEMPTMGRR